MRVIPNADLLERNGDTLGITKLRGGEEGVWYDNTAIDPPAKASVEADNMFETLVLQPLQLGGDFLSLAIVFFVLAILAAIVGARGVAGVSMSIAKWLIIIFVILAVLSLILPAI